MSGSDGSTRDERRVVTAVFADLVGSTALAPAMVKPWIHGWWEFGNPSSPRA